MKVRRGEVWLVDFGEPVGREQSGLRPAVAVSSNALHESGADLAIVVPCTTTRRALPSHIEIEPTTSGLEDVSYAKCEDVKSVSSRRLVRRLGEVDAIDMAQIARVLTYLLEL